MNRSKTRLKQEIIDLIKNDEEKGLKIAQEMGIKLGSLSMNISREAPLMVKEKTINIIKKVFSLPKNAKLTEEIEVTIKVKG